jgi:hypothetical protein
VCYKESLLDFISILGAGEKGVDDNGTDRMEI